MNKLLNMKSFSVSSYLDKNRKRINEALVSLRLMKEVDDFIVINNINQKDLASQLDYSNAYISQLMTGAKKINASFINKFEQAYDVKIEFKIKCKKTSHYVSKNTISSPDVNLLFHFNFQTHDFLEFVNKEIKTEESIYTNFKASEEYEIVDFEEII